MRTGSATAPLHGGRCPPWLFKRMKPLARAIAVHLVEHAGREELLRRLSDPVWFHAFGCVLGFDWNSSGVTTTVCGALKEGLAPASKELGIYVCGGKGGTSRKTPKEIAEVCEATGQDADTLADASRMSAKVDSACVQDGFELYHHVFLFTEDGDWAVVQQGLRDEDKLARRYHWLGNDVDLASLRMVLGPPRKPIEEPTLFDFDEKPEEPPTASRKTKTAVKEATPTKSFISDPHAAVSSEGSGKSPVLNLVASEASGNRNESLNAARLPPRELLDHLTHIHSDKLALPRRHDVRVRDIDWSRIERIQLKTYEQMPETFESLVAFPGVGAKTLRALSLVAELIYEEPASFRDPARFSFAHGGKDGHPYPVNRTVYDEVIHHLGETVNKAKLSQVESADAMKRLAKWRGRNNA